MIGNLLVESVTDIVIKTSEICIRSKIIPKIRIMSMCIDFPQSFSLLGQINVITRFKELILYQIYYFSIKNVFFFLHKVGCNLIENVIICKTDYSESTMHANGVIYEFFVKSRYIVATLSS